MIQRRWEDTINAIRTAWDQSNCDVTIDETALRAMLKPTLRRTDLSPEVRFQLVGEDVNTGREAKPLGLYMNNELGGVTHEGDAITVNVNVSKSRCLSLANLA